MPALAMDAQIAAARAVSTAATNAATKDNRLSQQTAQPSDRSSVEIRSMRPSWSHVSRDSTVGVVGPQLLNPASRLPVFFAHHGSRPRLRPSGQHTHESASGVEEAECSTSGSFIFSEDHEDHATWPETEPVGRMQNGTVLSMPPHTGIHEPTDCAGAAQARRGRNASRELEWCQVEFKDTCDSHMDQIIDGRQTVTELEQEHSRLVHAEARLREQYEEQIRCLDLQQDTLPAKGAGNHLKTADGDALKVQTLLRDSQQQ
jgi:hypothetical protein